MSNLRFMKELNNLTRMDESIKGPMPRWQKKCTETSNSSINVSTTSLNSSRKVTNCSFTSSASGKSSTNKNDSRKTPSKGTKKSPSRTTPAKTPNGGDRFIPSRATTNFDLSHYKILQQQNADQNADKQQISPSKREMQRLLGENLHGGDINNTRVLSYQIKAPAPPEGYQNPLKVLYSQTKTPGSVRATTRYIPQAPERILDAPEIIDDYYLNLVDWSSSNILAVALGANVYLWNAGSGTIEQLFELEGNDYVCSVGWIQEGPYLAVGTTVGNTELWDCSACLNSIDTKSQVCALLWSTNYKEIVSGHGYAQNQLTIWKYPLMTKVADLTGHSSRVLHLAMSPDGTTVLSAGADETLRLWKCFQMDPRKKKEASDIKSAVTSKLAHTIR
ncbi:hypothetical protein DMN91_008928 [Ooceraea biroi]|uniref:Uncharacterized protein n=1 Tax=Ooceraea biroi TaxID=2015173 RepID=A0A3L8DE19_OOCBI|nr:hypothetical protein DMN91_008928 [Ooceraea biroi]